jgi:hypothetical protein
MGSKGQSIGIIQSTISTRSSRDMKRAKCATKVRATSRSGKPRLICRNRNVQVHSPRVIWSTGGRVPRTSHLLSLRGGWRTLQSAKILWMPHPSAFFAEGWESTNLILRTPYTADAPAVDFLAGTPSIPTRSQPFLRIQWRSDGSSTTASLPASRSARA